MIQEIVTWMQSKEKLYLDFQSPPSTSIIQASIFTTDMLSFSLHFIMCVCVRIRGLGVIRCTVMNPILCETEQADDDTAEEIINSFLDYLQSTMEVSQSVTIIKTSDRVRLPCLICITQIYYY